MLNTFAPLKQKRVKHIHLPEWFNPDILKSSKERDKAKKSDKTEEY